MKTLIKFIIFGALAVLWLGFLAAWIFDRALLDSIWRVFQNMPLGARINAIYSSDIGHFDVVDMRDPLPEAFELVEDGHITESDFHDFVFGNAVRLWGTQNPRFFEGTAVAREAAVLLKRGAPTVRDAT